MSKILNDILSPLDSITEGQYRQFEIYKDLLLEWNQKMNLTAITEPEEIYYKHFLDSAYLLKVYQLEANSTCIDVGTGAGFPGIPLAIMRPDIHFTLVDALNKRILFLEQVVADLGLQNVTCYHGRAEDLARDLDFRGCFDYGVTRAVAPMSVLLEYLLPFIKDQGALFAYKSTKASEELTEAENALNVLGGKVDTLKEFELSNDLYRTIIKIDKQGPISDKYPRRAGKPTKSPL